MNEYFIKEFTKLLTLFNFNSEQVLHLMNNALGDAHLHVMNYQEHEEYIEHIEYQKRQAQIEFELQEIQHMRELEEEAQANADKIAYRRYKISLAKKDINISDDELSLLSMHDFEVLMGNPIPLPDENLYPNIEEDLPW